MDTMVEENCFRQGGPIGDQVAYWWVGKKLFYLPLPGHLVDPTTTTGCSVHSSNGAASHKMVGDRMGPKETLAFIGKDH